MNTQYDVLVVGGGIIGLTTALAMAHRQFSVAIVDAGDLVMKDGGNPARVFAINQASRRLFDQLRVWDTMESSSIAPYLHMYVWDAVSKAHIEFDCRTIHSDRLGSIIDEVSIKKALMAAIAAEKIDLFPNHGVTQVENAGDGMIVTTAVATLQARLLMIADGANSKTRELLQIPIRSWPYHQNAIVATIRTQHPHQQTAFQVFNSEGPLAFLPLPDPHECSIVWSVPPTQADALMGLGDEEFNLRLEKAFASKLGCCKLISAKNQFPLLMRHTKQYVGEHWMLLGDAAHSIHPLAGLGLNLGLADVHSWLSILDKKRVLSVNQQMLGAYQRQRKHAVWQVVWLMEGLKALFANPLQPVAAIRGFGLGICNKISFLKRLLISHAAGDL